MQSSQEILQDIKGWTSIKCSHVKINQTVESSNRESVSTRYESPIKGEGPVEMVNTQDLNETQKMTMTYMGQEQTIIADRFGRFTDSMRFKISGSSSLTEKALIKVYDGDKLVGESNAKMQTLMNGGTNYTGNPVHYKTARELKYHISTPKE